MALWFRTSECMGQTTLDEPNVGTTLDPICLPNLHIVLEGPEADLGNQDSWSYAENRWGSKSKGCEDGTSAVNGTPEPLEKVLFLFQNASTMFIYFHHGVRMLGAS